MTTQANVTQTGGSGVGFTAKENWILDSGITHHMTTNLNHLNHITPYHGDRTITIGNGTGLAVTHIGSTSIPTSNTSLVLRNVLCVPKITVNLLSVKKLCRDNGCWFIYDDLIFFIQDKATRKILYQGNSDGGELFTIPVNVFAKLEQCVSFIGKKIQVSKWHKRLSHHQKRCLLQC